MTESTGTMDTDTSTDVVRGHADEWDEWTEFGAASAADMLRALVEERDSLAKALDCAADELSACVTLTTQADAAAQIRRWAAKAKAAVQSIQFSE